jgi:LAGLIDADG endonuclease
LEWFIGFSEGDGSFGIITSDLHQDRYSYCINQADLRVLKFIQKMLGFGNITTYKQKTKVNNGVEERIYGRFLVKNPREVEILIHLFNGNLHIKKCQRTFEIWVRTYNNLYSTNIKVKSLGDLKRINLENRWLVGFWEADGGFSASFNNRMRLKAYIDQNDEQLLLEHIRSLFGGGSVYLRTGTANVYRVEFQGSSQLQQIIKYCNHLVGRKKDAFDIWVKIVSFFLNQDHLLPLNFSIIRELVAELQYLNKLFKIKKSVLILEELDENN